MRKTLHSLITGTVISAGVLASCASPVPHAGQSRFVVIDAEALGRFNPLLGHGASGESKIYESLYRIAEGQDTRVPDAVPVLAEGPPRVVDGDETHWRVTTRQGVAFSDGAPFGPADVAATYNAVIDKRFASPVAANFDFLKKAVVTGPNTVDFLLNARYGDVPHRLFLSIAPAKYFSEAAPADQSPLNDHPVGTGPYRLVSLRPDQAVFEARETYWGRKPAVKTFIVRRADDDQARAAQVRGEADGTRLPPALAKAVAKDGYRLVSAKTGDWLGITLPQGGPVTGDPAVKLALNYGVDRDAMVRHILDGRGQPVSTLVTSVYGSAYDPAQDFVHDEAKARAILDEAGWRAGVDGVRSRDGLRARFDVAYYPDEVVRRDLVMAAVSDAKRIGIELTPVAVEKPVMTAQYLAKTAFLLGGGGLPYTLDSQLYPKFHSKYAVAGVGSKWDNASDYVNPEVDRILDAARAEDDPEARAALYRAFQAAYHARPAMLALVQEEHVYVVRDNGCQIGPTALEPHTHGVAWGPWYSLARWTC